MWSSGSTAYNYFDTDNCFTSTIDKFTKWVYIRLGCSINKVELSENMIFQAYEDSWLLASRIINEYQAKNTLTSLLGKIIITGSNGLFVSPQGAENKYPYKNLDFQNRLNEAYTNASTFDGEKNYNIYSSSLEVKNGQQNYDLKELLSSSTGGKDFDIDQIWYYSPYDIQTNYYYDYLTYMGYDVRREEFGVSEIKTSTVAFYLLPVWEDMLRAQVLKTRNMVRKSHYGFDILNNILRLYPPPQADYTMWVSYKLKQRDPLTKDAGGLTDETVTGVANLSNAPFGIIAPCNLNSIIHDWVTKYGLALCKEMLGNVRGKFTSYPIPGESVTLNGPELLAQAKEEYKQLLEELNKILTDTTYEKLVEQEANIAKNSVEINTKSPTFIYRF